MVIFLRSGRPWWLTFLKHPEMNAMSNRRESSSGGDRDPEDHRDVAELKRGGSLQPKVERARDMESARGGCRDEAPRGARVTDVPIGAEHVQLVGGSGLSWQLCSNPTVSGPCPTGGFSPSTRIRFQGEDTGSRSGPGWSLRYSAEPIGQKEPRVASYFIEEAEDLGSSGATERPITVR